MKDKFLKNIFDFIKRYKLKDIADGEYDLSYVKLPETYYLELIEYLSKNEDNSYYLVNVGKNYFTIYAPFEYDFYSYFNIDDFHTNFDIDCRNPFVIDIYSTRKRKIKNEDDLEIFKFLEYDDKNNKVVLTQDFIGYFNKLTRKIRKGSRANVLKPDKKMLISYKLLKEIVMDINPLIYEDFLNRYEDFCTDIYIHEQNKKINNYDNDNNKENREYEDDRTILLPNNYKITISILFNIPQENKIKDSISEIFKCNKYKEIKDIIFGIANTNTKRTFLLYFVEKGFKDYDKILKLNDSYIKYLSLIDSKLIFDPYDIWIVPYKFYSPFYYEFYSILSEKINDNTIRKIEEVANNTLKIKNLLTEYFKEKENIIEKEEIEKRFNKLIEDENLENINQVVDNYLKTLSFNGAVRRLTDA